MFAVVDGNVHSAVQPVVLPSRQVMHWPIMHGAANEGWKGTWIHTIEILLESILFHFVHDQKAREWLEVVSCLEVLTDGKTRACVLIYTASKRRL